MVALGILFVFYLNENNIAVGDKCRITCLHFETAVLVVLRAAELHFGNMTVGLHLQALCSQ